MRIGYKRLAIDGMSLTHPYQSNNGQFKYNRIRYTAKWRRVPGNGAYVALPIKGKCEGILVEPVHYFTPHYIVELECKELLPLDTENARALATYGVGQFRWVRVRRAWEIQTPWEQTMGVKWNLKNQRPIQVKDMGRHPRYIAWPAR